MEQVVVDTNVLVASFLQGDTHHQQAQPYLIGLEAGDYTFHLPMLVVVEVVAAIRRPAPIGWLALLVRARKSITDWEQSGKVVLYPLDRDRMDRSTAIAQQHRLRGGDSVMAALSDELGMPLKTFDQDILQKFQQASV
ncbi:MAG TPA: type II toxin-antitoxin system VapC family toxin [Dehalococcoidia bacterium]|nr:type II toxin-antitoxin system VapC family toxin [Dehalococcoidia bacterium]